MDDDYDFLTSVQSLDVFRQLESASTEHSSSQHLNLIAEHADDLLVWNEIEAAVMCVSLKQLRVNPERARVWVLACTNPPSAVERLVISTTGKYVALICQNSIWIVEMPSGVKRQSSIWARGEGEEKEKGTPPTKQMKPIKIDCRSYPLGERYFVTAGDTAGVILQARWHPSSEADIHLVVLTKDSCLRIFNVLDPESAEQVIQLISQPITLQSANEFTFFERSKSYALDDSDNVVDFDFGPKCPVPKYHGFSLTADLSLVDQVFILKENGDVHCLYPRLHEDSRYPVFLSDALHMHPPAEDNYGVDACSLISLSTTPTVLAIATAAGTVYHCVVMDQEEMDGENELDPDRVPLQTLYVYEAVDLELNSIDEVEETGTSVGMRGELDEDISYVVLHKDPVVSNRYHCSHLAGVHTVTLTWLDNQEQLFDESEDQPMLSLFRFPSRVEHMIETQPLPDSQLLPIIGLCISTDRLVGITLISVTALGECLAIRLMANLTGGLPPRKVTDKDNSQ
jgi:nuclear pore complex protein Nup88